MQQRHRQQGRIPTPQPYQPSSQPFESSQHQQQHPVRYHPEYEPKAAAEPRHGYFLQHRSGYVGFGVQSKRLATTTTASALPATATTHRLDAIPRRFPGSSSSSLPSSGDCHPSSGFFLVGFFLQVDGAGMYPRMPKLCYCFVLPRRWWWLGYTLLRCRTRRLARTNENSDTASSSSNNLHQPPQKAFVFLPPRPRIVLSSFRTTPFQFHFAVFQRRPSPFFLLAKTATTCPSQASWQHVLVAFHPQPQNHHHHQTSTLVGISYLGDAAKHTHPHFLAFHETRVVASFQKLTVVFYCAVQRSNPATRGKQANIL